MNKTSRNISLINHILLYTLYELGVFAALWQYGDPFITTVLLVAVPVLAFGVYIPEKYIILRSVLQKIIMICAVSWGVYRFQQVIPLDLNLVESFAILGLGFSFDISKKEYGIMMGIAIVLSGYGAIIPPRILYFFLIIPIFIIALLALYNTRTSSFSKGARDLKISGISLSNIWIYVGHFCLVMLLWALIFPFIPTTDLAFSGLNEVSFDTDNDTIKDFSEWYTPTKFKESKQSSYMVDGKAPSAVSEHAKNLIKADTELSMNAFGNGGGAASPGKRLIMKVKSPVKLYWLAQLYDRYDGRKWISTKKMQNQRISPKFYYNTHYKAIPQAFSIKQFISPKLYSGFLVKNLKFDAQSSHKIKQRYYKLTLKKNALYPTTPFRYTVKSILPADEETTKEGKPSLKHWFERLKPAHYLKLPQKAISKRLRKLARKLTKKWKTPLEKSYAIRNFLRTKFKYNLYSVAPPKNKEAVDFFLFDLKEGHCEYFAASFAVLARLAKLPTRVATGFSPGNFNVLDGTFEVFEYHAHAWAQVFVPGKGWLTMDPVPPGQMNIKTTPGFIGSMKDPFSDEWSIKAPELAKEVKEFNDSDMNSQNTNASSLLAKIAMKIPTSRKELNNSVSMQKQNDFASFNKKKKKFSFQKLLADIQDSFTTFIENLWSAFLNIKTSNILLMISYIVIIILGIIFYPVINKYLDFNQKMQNSNIEFEYAMHSQVDNPNQCILHCYATINDLLDLCKINRPANVDLEKYSNSLHKFNKELQKNVKPVFELYSLLHYGAEDITVIDSHEALICTKESRKILLKHLDKKKKVRYSA